MKKKLVVHLAETPLAGAPIRIVNALNLYTNYEARLINFNPQCYGSRTYPEDINWQNENQAGEAMRLINDADIFHVHHPIKVNSIHNVFKLKFTEVNPNAKFLFQFGSNKNHFDKDKIEYIDNMHFGKSVIIHCAERDYMGYSNLPNIINCYDKILSPLDTSNELPVVFYSPSSPYGVAEKRWNSKGKREVLKMLRKIQRKVDFEICLVESVPYEECMELKRKSDIVIDDITTGSFHLTSLEGLSMGKPTVSYLDSRTVSVLTSFTGSRDLPFVNVRIKELAPVLIELLNDPSLRRAVGGYSRRWIEEYYSPEINVRHYEKLYERILHGDQNTLADDDFEAKDFLYRKVNDCIWEEYFKEDIIKHRILKKIF